MPDYSLSELAALTGLSARTIRFYVTQGLVPSPGREGRGTRYPETTLARLRLICSLRDAHQPLAEIRRQLEALTDDEVLALSAGPPEPPGPGSALEYVRRLLGSEQPDAQPDGLALQQLAMLPPPASPGAVEPLLDELRAPSYRQRRSIDLQPGLVRSSKPSSSVGDRSQWERIFIGPDIELHVRRPLGKPANRTVERLIAFARQLQGETEK